MLRAITIMLAIGLSTGLHADTAVGFSGGTTINNPLKPSAKGIKSLFASQKFDMQQTVGISFGAGSNRFSQYYLNTMTYKVSEPLTIQATLGVQNRKLSSDAFGSSGARVIVPNIGVLYQPKPNLKIQFSFSNSTDGYGYDPYWMRRGY